MPDTKIRGALTARLLAADDGAGDALTGAFSALVSAYGVKYRIGYRLWHTIEAGAFAASIADQPAVPIYQMHSWAWSELPPIGHATARETEQGLVVDGQLYVDDSEAARVVARAMKAGAMREWSIGYAVLVARVDPDDDLHEIVVEGELLEASSVLRGANPATQTLQVAGAGAGRTRLHLGDSIVIDTDDHDLIARLTTPNEVRASLGLDPVTPVPAPDPVPAFDGSSLLARAAVRNTFGNTAD